MVILDNYKFLLWRNKIDWKIKTLHWITTQGPSSFLIDIFPLREDDRNLLQFHPFLGLSCLLIGSFSKRRWQKDPIKQTPNWKQFFVYPSLYNSEPSQMYDFHRGFANSAELLTFLNSSTTDILGQITLHRGGCPVHCRMFTSIWGLYPRMSVIVVTTKTSPGGGKIAPAWERLF